MKINGQELRVTPASFDEAMDLQDAIAEALKQTDINIDLDTMLNNEDSEKIEVGTGAVDTVVKTVLSLASSKKVRNCLFVCAERAVLGEEKVNREFFAAIENREHYYPVMVEIVRVNLSPFFKKISSGFSGLINIDKIKSRLKQK